MPDPQVLAQDESPQYDPRHPHEPQIPPVLDEDGRCLVCLLLVAVDEAEQSLRMVGPLVGRILKGG
jgi:hypothetical protein